MGMTQEETLQRLEVLEADLASVTEDVDTHCCGFAHHKGAPDPLFQLCPYAARRMMLGCAHKFEDMRRQGILLETIQTLKDLDRLPASATEDFQRLLRNVRTSLQEADAWKSIGTRSLPRVEAARLSLLERLTQRARRAQQPAVEAQLALRRELLTHIFLAKLTLRGQIEENAK